MNNQKLQTTAARAGISEKEQLIIALELILSQGGIASMHQIYKAVENNLPPGSELSKQGRDSLRRVINSRAIEKGVIYQFNSEAPGWRITIKGVDYVRRVTGREIGTIRITAPILLNAQLALEEIRTTLFSNADDLERLPRAKYSSGWVKKAGVILTITVWETFIEDIFLEVVKQKLDSANSAEDMGSLVNSIAKSWYDDILKKSTEPKPKDFVKWTGDRWKLLILEKLENELSKLNTPNSTNVQDLSKRYLGIDLTQSWVWVGTSFTSARERLDKLINLRGEITHRAGKYFELGDGVTLADVSGAIRLIEKLIVLTEKRVGELI